MCSLDRLWRLLRTAVGVFLDLLTFFRLILRTSQAVAAENLFLRKQLALICRATNKTSPSHRRRPFHPGSTLGTLRLARCSHCSETRYADPLASERISVVLEMEVPIRRSAAGARRGSQADRRDVGEQSDLGRRTDRRRSLVKDRHSHFPANGPALYADRTEATQNDFSTLDDVRAESCESDHRV